MASKNTATPAAAVALTGIALLTAISAAQAANEGNPGYYMGTAAELNDAISAGDVIVDQSITEGEGDNVKAAAKLTEQGVAKVQAAETEADKPKVASNFTIDTDIALPSARGGKGGSVYPFDDLPVNGSFFVPATTDRPNPAKSLASTVSSATKRYEDAKKADGTADVRKFTVRSVDETAQGRGKGARVWRTA